ncbi:hypothetical protein [Mesorhizobium sp. L-8-3]|uniref:hypothetical protein n=1 Tax=Mesorhizobium sp. L-8-3 TaxID=2744522 RepID=UPI001926C447|nr:hypothetical protein [Mesorhizobium sp. L-8-3]
MAEPALILCAAIACILGAVRDLGGLLRRGSISPGFTSSTRCPRRWSQASAAMRAALRGGSPPQGAADAGPTVVRQEPRLDEDEGWHLLQIRATEALK